LSSPAESQNRQGGTGINLYAGKILEWQSVICIDAVSLHTHLKYKQEEKFPENSGN